MNLIYLLQGIIKIITLQLKKLVVRQLHKATKSIFRGNLAKFYSAKLFTEHKNRFDSENIYSF